MEQFFELITSVKIVVDYKNVISANAGLPDSDGEMLEILKKMVSQSSTCKQSLEHLDNTNLRVSQFQKEWQNLSVPIYDSVTDTNYFTFETIEYFKMERKKRKTFRLNIKDRYKRGLFKAKNPEKGIERLQLSPNE